jgi:hypothetical protein
MGKATKAMRTYKVVDREGAKELGASMFSDSDYNRFALVAVRGDKLDNVVCWGFKREALDAKAEARNKDIAMLGKMMGKASDMLEVNDESEAD